MLAKIIQKSEILSKSQKYDWKLMIYEVLTILASANRNRLKANLNRSCITTSRQKRIRVYLWQNESVPDDGSAIPAFDTLDLHLKFHLSMPNGNATDRTRGIAGMDDMLTFTARATKFVRTSLDFLITDTKGVVQKAGIHCYCCLITVI